MRKHTGKKGDSKRIIIISAVAIILMLGVFSTISIAADSGSSLSFGQWLKKIFSSDNEVTGNVAYAEGKIMQVEREYCPIGMESLWNFEDVDIGKDAFEKNNGAMVGTPTTGFFTDSDVLRTSRYIQLPGDSYVEIPNGKINNALKYGGFAIRGWACPDDSLPHLYKVEFSAYDYDGNEADHPSEYQVRIAFNNGDFDYSHTAIDGYGNDIEFNSEPDGSGEVFPHWIEKWDVMGTTGSIGESVVWVRFPYSYIKEFYMLAWDGTKETEQKMWDGIQFGEQKSGGVFDYNPPTYIAYTGDIDTIAAGGGYECFIMDSAAGAAGDMLCNPSEHLGPGEQCPFGVTAGSYNDVNTGDVVKIDACTEPDQFATTCWLDTMGDVHCQGAETGGLSGKNADDIAAGVNHACAITGAGNLECWGEPGWGSLAAGALMNFSMAKPCLGMAVDNPPSLITGLDGLDASAHDTCLLYFGKICCFGEKTAQFGQPLANPTSFIQLSMTNDFVCGLTDAGHVYCGAFDKTNNPISFEGHVYDTAVDPYSNINVMQIAAQGQKISTDDNRRVWVLKSDGNVDVFGAEPAHTPELEPSTYKNVLGMDAGWVDLCLLRPENKVNCIQTDYEFVCPPPVYTTMYDTENPFRKEPYDQDSDIIHPSIVKKEGSFEIYPWTINLQDYLVAEVYGQSGQKHFIQIPFNTIPGSEIGCGDHLDECSQFGLVYNPTAMYMYMEGLGVSNEIANDPVNMTSSNMLFGELFKGKLDDFSLMDRTLYRREVLASYQKFKCGLYSYCEGKTNVCGNGVVDPGEQCDLGVIDNMNHCDYTDGLYHPEHLNEGCFCTLCFNDSDINGIPDIYENWRAFYTSGSLQDEFSKLPENAGEVFYAGSTICYTPGIPGASLGDIRYAQTEEILDIGSWVCGEPGAIELGPLLVDVGSNPYSGGGWEQVSDIHYLGSDNPQSSQACDYCQIGQRVISAGVPVDVGQSPWDSSISDITGIQQIGSGYTIIECADLAVQNIGSGGGLPIFKCFNMPNTFEGQGVLEKGTTWLRYVEENVDRPEPAVGGNAIPVDKDCWSSCMQGNGECNVEDMDCCIKECPSTLELEEDPFCISCKTRGGSICHCEDTPPDQLLDCCAPCCGYYPTTPLESPFAASGGGEILGCIQDAEGPCAGLCTVRFASDAAYDACVGCCTFGDIVPYKPAGGEIPYDELKILSSILQLGTGDIKRIIKEERNPTVPFGECVSSICQAYFGVDPASLTVDLQNYGTGWQTIGSDTVFLGTVVADIGTKVLFQGSGGIGCARLCGDLRTLTTRDMSYLSTRIMALDSSDPMGLENADVGMSMKNLACQANTVGVGILEEGEEVVYACNLPGISSEDPNCLPECLASGNDDCPAEDYRCCAESCGIAVVPKQPTYDMSEYMLCRALLKGMDPSMSGHSLHYACMNFMQ